MALVTRLATEADARSLVALWNARASDPTSCWRRAEPMTATMLAALVADGFSFAIVEQEGAAVGFSYWRGAELLGLAGATAEVYYTALAAYCAGALAEGHPQGSSVLPLSENNEFTWMAALGDVIQLQAIGYVPSLPGEPRVPKVALATADLAALRAVVLARLEY